MNMKPNTCIILFILLIIPGTLFSADSTFCSLGQAMQEDDIAYHMFDPFICHEEISLSSMEPEDYSDTCDPIGITESDGEFGIDNYYKCGAALQKVNQEFLSKEKNNVHKACVANSEEEFNKAIKLANGNFVYNNSELYYFGEEKVFVEACVEGKIENCAENYCPDYCADNAEECGEDGEGCFENCAQDVCPEKVLEDGSCMATPVYSIKPAYWAFEHTCTVGVGEYDLHSNPVARYRFDNKGKIEKQLYNKDKKEWGYISKPSNPNSWVKDDWVKDTTGWCANNNTHCIINKRIEVKAGVKLTKPIVIDEQEQKTSLFRIEIKYNGKDNPKFPGISFNPKDVYDGMSPHQFIISGFDLAGQNFYGEMLPIYPDLKDIKTYTKLNDFYDKVLKGELSPIFTASPFYDDKAVGGMGEASEATCAEYGLTSCYIAEFSYEEENSHIAKNACGQDVFVPGSVSIYRPDWVGVYLNNKFQFAGCGTNLNTSIFECDEKIIIQTDQDFKYGDPVTYKWSCDGIKETYTVKPGFVSWHTKVIIPKDKIIDNKEYQFVFNEFGRTSGFGNPEKENDGGFKDNIITFVKRNVNSPLACAKDEAKFKGKCIKSTECAAKNGYLKQYMGNDVCLLCGANETLIGNSCANKYKLNTCETENRVWETDSCGGCKASFNDIEGVCINTASEKAACKAKSATHGEWTYSSTSNTCSFACDPGFTEGLTGFCELKCDENGMTPNANETGCSCDSANHWVPYSGGGCMCEDGHTPSGNVCVATNPPGPDTCGSVSECDDDEICKDGKCQKEEPQPFKGECKSNEDCGTGMICLSQNNKCACDTDNDWNLNDNKDGCEYNEAGAVEAMCKLNGGEYLEDRCIYNKTEVACLKGDGKWEEDACWHDPDGDGEWAPDTDLPENSSNKSGCGCTMGNASLPESLGSVLPYLLVLGIVMSLRARRTKQSPASK